MKQNIYQHNLRLNLNRQDDLELHRALMNFDKDKYRSKNDFLKRKLCESIFGNGDSQEQESNVLNTSEYVTKEELEQRIAKVVADVLKELSVWFVTSLVSGRCVPIEVDNEKGQSKDDDVTKGSKWGKDF